MLFDSDCNGIKIVLLVIRSGTKVTWLVLGNWICGGSTTWRWRGEKCASKQDDVFLLSLGYTQYRGHYHPLVSCTICSISLWNIVVCGGGSVTERNISWMQLRGTELIKGDLFTLANCTCNTLSVFLYNFPVAGTIWNTLSFVLTAGCLDYQMIVHILW